ncbi:MAG: class I SAM-dependent methyltransferase, partial [Polyangiaceae bacterium]
RKAPLPDSFEAVVDRVADRYARGSKFTRGYVRSKMNGDPVVRALFDRSRVAKFGKVSDVGCGRGQLSVMLLEAKTATSTNGFDWDEAKIDEAKRATESLPEGAILLGPECAFFKGDLRSQEIAACDTALLLDVLHYLTSEEQDALLERVAAATRETIFVRELDPDRGWRSSVTRFQERITTRLGVNRGARVLLRPISEITSVLEKNGFDVEVTTCWAGTPFSNVLVTATRRLEKAKTV